MTEQSCTQFVLPLWLMDKVVASFPGHSCLQFLIACMQYAKQRGLGLILQVIKNWRRKQPENKANKSGSVAQLLYAVLVHDS